jgi:hypothetical protein
MPIGKGSANQTRMLHERSTAYLALDRQGELMRRGLRGKEQRKRLGFRRVDAAMIRPYCACRHDAVASLARCHSL